MPLTRPKAAQINFDVTTISDPLLRFNSGQTGSNDKDAGFIIERGDDTNVGLVWDESADEFAVVSTTETGTTSGNITISAYANIRANAFYGDGSNLTGLSSDVVSDTTPQLGGDLDMNSNNITGTNVNIDIDGTGSVQVGNLYIGQNGYAVNEINTTSNGGSGKHIYVTTGANGDFVVKNDSWMTGNTQFRAIYDDAVELYYNGSKKLETTNTGISITTTSTDDALLITSTNTYADASPVITLKRNSGTPADADYLGQIKFKGENDADQEVVYAKITAKIQDVTDGTEDGIIEFMNKKAGSNTITARLSSDSLQLLNGTNLTVDGTVDATSYTGDGSGLSGIATNSITQGDSSITVTDTGTGTAVVTIDNATHTTFNSSGITLASGVFSGTATSAQYADLAEMYASDKNYEVGTVVCVGGDKEVTECNAYADSKLAGVVSDKPAYLMNRDIDAEYPICVGFVGRVPVKVVGHIEKGDLLTTSEIKGFATKFSEGSYNPGCIIGISLNDKKESGEGIVEVLLKRS